MANCCEDKSCEITALPEKHRRVLQIVLVINTALFACGYNLAGKCAPRNEKG